jgi:hypothetical protein
MAKILDPDLLTYSVNSATNNLRFNTTNKTIQLVAGGNLVAKDGVTGQCLFSKIKEVIKADADLIKYALPVREMIHDESMELVNDWKFYDDTTIKMVRDCGVAYVNTAGAITAMFACMVTLGEIASGTSESTDLYFVQDSASNATLAYFTHLNTGTTFGVNELVQIYRDDDGDGNTSEGSDFDRRAYFKVFLRRAGYTFDESKNADIGYSSLTYKKYNFPITHSVDAGVTVDDTTLSGYTGMSITWYNSQQSYSLGTNGPYNFHLVVAANGKTYQEVYSWVQYQLRLSSDIDTGASVRTGKVAPALVFMNGSTLTTIYQDTNDSFEGGIHVTNLAGNSLNNIAERDDTNALRSYPYVAAITFTFDSYLVQDGADGKFWIYDASTYPGAGATLLKDASDNDMTGTIPLDGDVSFSYNYSTDKPWKGVAVGKDHAKIAEATGTIMQSTGNVGVFTAGQERWYSNPA